jgi:hypothetical protein
VDASSNRSLAANKLPMNTAAMRPTMMSAAPPESDLQGNAVSLFGRHWGHLLCSRYNDGVQCRTERTVCIVPSCSEP